MKTLPRFSLNRFYNFLAGAALLYPLLSPAQDAPLSTPSKTDYPGIIQTFEKLIQVDTDKINKRTGILTQSGSIFSTASEVQNLDLEPDFLNSIVLHSDPGYLRMAASDKCRFYEAILTDLLRSSEGKIKNVLMTYVEKGQRLSAIISRKDFLSRVVNAECPETQKNIAVFQVKTIQQAFRDINFDIPAGIDQCRNAHTEWVQSPKTPFLCQVHEYLKEARLGGGDPKDLPQRRAVARILEEKITPMQRDYIQNLCTHLDDEDLFCEEFLNVSFWSKITAGYEDRIYAEDICKGLLKSPAVSDAQYSLCLTRLKKERDACLYPAGTNSGLRPQLDCDLLSTALNHSTYKANFRDCPGNSDQFIATNLGRILHHFSPGYYGATQGPCSAVSAGQTFRFKKQYDNETNWKLEACYTDQVTQKEVCLKTFFGQFDNDPASYTNVVATILKRTRGAVENEKCEMVDSAEYNPLMLKYKSGCYIIYERDRCFISECKHRILFNDRPIDLIRLKGPALLSYFPLSVQSERFSEHYLLTHDFKKIGRSLTTLNAITAYLKKGKSGIVEGVGCAEDLLPTFFKSATLNQCSPLPFVISGMLRENDKVMFVTRTAADSLQAPRLLSWSTVFSGVKSYQRIHPLKLWTLYGLD